MNQQTQRQVISLPKLISASSADELVALLRQYSLDNGGQFGAFQILSETKAIIYEQVQVDIVYSNKSTATIVS